MLVKVEWSDTAEEYWLKLFQSNGNGVMHDESTPALRPVASWAGIHVRRPLSLPETRGGTPTARKPSKSNLNVTTCNNMEKWGKGYSQNADNNESHNVRISGKKLPPLVKKMCWRCRMCDPGELSKRANWPLKHDEWIITCDLVAVKRSLRWENGRKKSSH